MNQSLTVILSAAIVGAISIGILAAYTTNTASKMPEHSEMTQIFISGAIVGGVVSWIISSGFLHGTYIMNMLSSDVSSVATGIGLKGGDESVVKSFDGPKISTVTVTTPSSSSSSSSSVDISSNSVSSKSPKMNIPALTNMVGGFFKAIGLDNNVLQELNVGMPTF